MAKVNTMQPITLAFLKAHGYSCSWVTLFIQKFPQGWVMPSEAICRRVAEEFDWDEVSEALFGGEGMRAFERHMGSLNSPDEYAGDGNTDRTPTQAYKREMKVYKTRQAMAFMKGWAAHCEAVVKEQKGRG